MPQYVPNQNSSLEIFYQRLRRIDHRLDALAALQTVYVAKGNSYYILDTSGNAVFILGDISTAPMGVGTSSPSSVSTGLSGRGAASYATGTWELVSGGGGGGGAVSSVSAGDASAVVSPTTGSVVIESGTLDEIANLHPPAANWSNSSKKITGGAAATASTDFAIFSQIPTDVDQLTITGKTVSSSPPTAAGEALIYNGSTVAFGNPSGAWTAAPPVSGYLGWWDASQISASDGSALSSWSDLSGNGYDLTQPTSGDQPTFYESTWAYLINGLPAVSFNGTSDFMFNTSFPNQAQPLTIFTVCLWSGTGSAVQMIFGGDTSGNTCLVWQESGVTTQGGGGSHYSGPGVLHAAQILVDQFNGASSLLGVAGTEPGARGISPVSSGNPGSASLGGGVVLGAGGPDTSPSNYYDGLIGEVIFYGSLLTPAQCAAIVRNLVTKWCLL